MLAVVMFVGVMATILAISYPVLMRFEQISRVRETWRVLESIQMATSQITPAPPATYPVFAQRLFSDPGRISQLIGPIQSGDAANYPDACGFSFNNQQETRWSQWGPFLARNFDPAVGLASPIGIINDDFIRISISGQWYLMVVIDQADLSDIVMLDQFDNNDGAIAGKVRWDTITGSTARLTYMITSNGGC
jgi:hypothetical protein